MPVRAIVFDLFGTLVTTGEGWRAYREVIAALPPWKWRAARRLALTQPIPTVTAFREHVGLRRGPAPAQLERLVANGLAAIRLYDDSIPTLLEARRRGLSLALLSNLAAPYKQPVFELGLDRHFDALVFSCDVGLAKPDPAIYVHVAEQLGLAPGELLMIGDTQRDDVRGPRAAGLRALHLDRHGRRGDLRDLAELFEHPLLRP